jgi:hypothetical protein
MQEVPISSGFLVFPAVAATLSRFGNGSDILLLFVNGSRLLGIIRRDMGRDMDDIPPRVSNRPSFAALSAEDEQRFLREQAGFEAAYRTTGDPQALCHALLHVWSSRQTTPGWLVLDILGALVEQRTDAVAERYRERMRHVQRFVAVRDLRASGHTKESALNAAVEILAAQRAAAERETIEKSYDRVRIDLDRQRTASEFFYLAELVPKASALAPRADSTLYTADSTIPTADTAGDTAASPASAPWFMRIAKR